MSKLNIDQKTVKKLFQDAKSEFLIPDYQRPYAWGEDECKTLWNDLYTFSFPDNDADKFDVNDSYFLGPIVTYKNKKGQSEIIDGQQRLTTLLLLLRSFYNRLGGMEDRRSKKMKEDIEQCIWRANVFGEYEENHLKIISKVSMDSEKGDFLLVLKRGEIPEKAKSRYVSNFSFFVNKVDEFINKYPSYFADFPARILNNCVLLPIEAESQDTALRIFSTLNDRGKPLSDADIFKAQLYKYYQGKGKKDDLMDKWRELEKIAAKTFHSTSGSPMDELFTRYMYYERALQGNKSSTTESLRKFYEKGDYRLFKNEKTLNNLVDLVHFWEDVDNQDNRRFSVDALRRFFVLNYAPNGMWTYIVSVYFMHNKDMHGKLENKKFCTFLDRITAFIWAYAISNPGVNSLRTPLYAEMVNIVNDREVEFKDFMLDGARLKRQLENFEFSNNRPITKSMIAWWAFSFSQQELLPLTEIYDIEHIYPRNRQSKESGLSNQQCLEMLGNKSLLERRINIRASDYRFADKIKYYEGYETITGEKRGTRIFELKKLANEHDDFREEDIRERSRNIVNRFIDYLSENGLLHPNDTEGTEQPEAGANGLITLNNRTDETQRKDAHEKSGSRMGRQEEPQRRNTGLSPTRQLYEKFWIAFTVAAGKDKRFTEVYRLHKALARSDYGMPIGVRTCGICLHVSLQKKIIAVSVYVDGNRELYEHLKSHRDEIDREMGEKLSWYEMSKDGKAEITISGDLEQTEKWEEYFTWMIDRAVRLRAAVLKHVK